MLTQRWYNGTGGPAPDFHVHRVPKIPARHPKSSSSSSGNCGYLGEIIARTSSLESNFCCDNLAILMISESESDPPNRPRPGAGSPSPTLSDLKSPPRWRRPLRLTPSEAAAFTVT
jgi:hypothetical protein